MNGPDTTAASRTAAEPSIRPAGPEDVKEIVRVHLSSFRGFFLAELGPAFLRAYYRLVLRFPQGVLLLAEQDGVVAGFVCGFVDPARFARTMSANKWRFLCPALRGVLARPRLLPRLVGNTRKTLGNARSAPASERCAELSSLAVRPDCMRRGVGRALVRAFVETARGKDAREVRLSTDAVGNDSVNSFYAKQGFQLVENFIAPGGRSMNQYVLPLSQQDR